MTLLWAYLLGLPPTSFETYRSRPSLENSSTPLEPNIFTTLLHYSFYLVMIAWHVAEAFVPPPPGKPDLWVVLNALIGAGGFGIAYLWCMWKLFTQCRQIDRQAAEEDSQKKKQ
jgi:alpha-1,3-glucosyltransferase